MRFKILSHAAMLIEAGAITLVTDPWILGSCYWRSWWNYPKPMAFPTEGVRYIYLTHLHWDHFHGPSLRKFPRSTTVLVPEAPSTRILDDLVGFGFKSVIELPHGKTFCLAPNFRITSYQFGFNIDSVLVIQDGSTTLVNMNDCKLTGLPLKQVLQRHPTVDFLFRSHSSAQPYPFCIEAEEKSDLRYRTNEYYVSDFVVTAKLLKPRYAIPFASNHCFLHRETWQYNDTVVNPLDVKRFFDHHKTAETECVVMVAGDSWDDREGFKLQDQDFFTARERHLQEYAREVAPILEDYYRKEDSVKLSFKAFEAYFRNFMNSLPWFSRLFFKPVIVFELLGQAKVRWVLDFDKKRIVEAKDRLPNYSFRIYVHPAVLRDCVQKGMFAVFAPSKRLKIEVRKGGVKDYFVFDQLIDLYEYMFLPVSKMLSARFIKNWIRRWREIVHLITVLVRAVLKRRSEEAISEFVPRTSL